MTVACAERHLPGNDADVAEHAVHSDGDTDASTTICDYLITETTPCPSDCRSIYGLVLDPAATCIDRFSPREIVWCATNGRISSFSGDCYILDDGTRVSIQWTPMNEPSDEYCSSLPNCVP